MNNEQIQDKIIEFLLDVGSMAPLKAIAEAIQVSENLVDANARALHEQSYIRGHYGLGGDTWFAPNNKTRAYLAKPERTPSNININIEGSNNIVGGRDVVLHDTRINNAVNQSDIPEEIQPELIALLEFIKSTDATSLEKETKKNEFLSKVRERFGELVVGTCSGLIVAASTGGFN